MAEFAEEGLEKLLPAFEGIKASRVLPARELEEFTKRCSRYEYRLQKRSKKVFDYNLYIAYLKDFLLTWQKTLKAKQKNASRDVVKRILQKKIAWLYKIRSERFKKADFYLEEARYSKDVKMLESASQAYNRLLQIHGSEPSHYIEAALFEGDNNLNWNHALCLFQLGLRKFPNNAEIWAEMSGKKKELKAKNDETKEKDEKTKKKNDEAKEKNKEIKEKNNLSTI